MFDAESDNDRVVLRAILANLGREICEPLERLHEGIGALLADCAKPISDAQRDQAQTMLTLCDDLARLTHESLGSRASGQGSG